VKENEFQLKGEEDMPSLVTSVKKQCAQALDDKRLLHVFVSAEVVEP
jgi:hypothetical protein